jgi:N utilization substance protein B
MTLYAFNRRDDSDLPRAEKELMFSIGKTYDLYHYLLLLAVELADLAADKAEQAKNKKMPTAEDLNPNRKFIDNRLISQLRDNEALGRYVAESKISWANARHVPALVFRKLLTWDLWKEYMRSPETTYQADKNFAISMITGFFPAIEELNGYLEEQSIYWNDDLDYVLIMIEKTLKKFKADTGKSGALVPLFKNEEDRQFVRILFDKAVTGTARCSELIDANTTNWEVERIALMDIMVMQLAITEILEFPEIPVKVTLNEYIEIAKCYCTPKSSTFVNGILDKIVREMREQGLFAKHGRGLVGE